MSHKKNKKEGGEDSKLNEWHHAVKTKRFDLVKHWFHPDIKFFSPVVVEPRTGPEEVLDIMMGGAKIFKNFAYNRELVSERTWVLELEFYLQDTITSSSSSQGKGLLIKGVDIIQWDRDYWLPGAQIVEFIVMLRPLPHATHLKAEMTKAILEESTKLGL